MFEPTISMTNDEIVKHMADSLMLDNIYPEKSPIEQQIMITKANISKLYETYTQKHPNCYLNPLILEAHCKTLSKEDEINLSLIILDDLHWKVTNILTKNRKYVSGNKTIN